ncbi:DNA primase [Skermanella aerolata KACC 11604]|uniref:DUF927 domain-containing protein n=2 Tax=Skermanella aerolata TaxID=393310 RepID=UPI0005CB3689|nr:DUF927 domain-containing protein [Skermanella aerolata]KJB91507.1 DNA primase [Skermanella aerolata KACC 11604]
MTGARYVRTDPIKEAVAGHELDVLSAIGIDWRGGRGHINCPYPDHGGKDDWRWDDSKACAFCTCIGKRPDEGGSHSIFDVVSAREGIDFEKAKVRVAEIIGCTDLIEEGGGGPRGQKQDAASLLSAPAENRDDALPRKYLAFRLGIEPAAMLMPTTKTVGIKALGYFDLPDAAGAKPKLVGMFPCAVFETIDAMGRRHAFRIYVAPDGQGKADLDGRDPKKSVRASDGVSTAGRSVLWGDPATAPHIIVCEGIETGAAVAVAMRTEIEAGKVVVAAAISASGIEAFQPWPATKHITVAADRDEKRTLSKPASRRGEKAARNFGAKLHDRVSVAIAMPGAAGEKADWLDIFLRDGLDAVRAGMQAAEPFEPSEDEAAAADADKEHAAELDDIVTAYPLPALGGTRLCYRHMPGGDIWVHKVTRISSGEETMVPVFSPLGVIAMLRHADQDDAYGLRVAVQDMSGQPRLVDFDRADLGRMNGVEIKAALFEAGLRVEADGEAIVVAILKAAKPTREMVVVSRPGWHRLTADVPVFVDPSGEVSGLPDGQNLELSAGARLPVPSAAGTFDDWRAAIETVIKADNCPHWHLGIIGGFAGPVLELAGMEACGINLSGMTSAGKTTAQRLAVSPWSSTKIGNGLLQSMRATENAVEGLAQRANGTVLALDEMAHADGKVIGRLIYSIAGGVGKARMTAGAKLKTPYAWNTFAILSGECSLEEKVRGDGGQWATGMPVRFPDIDVTSVNRNAGQDVLNAIDAACRNHGHAGPAFVKALIAEGMHRDPDRLRESVNQAARKLAGPGADSALIRAAISFALLLVAGQMAKAFNLLPASMEVSEAVNWAWCRFLASTDAVVLNPEDQAIGNIIRWIAERWGVTIRHVDGDGGMRDAVAWHDDRAVYLPTERIREAAGGALKEQQIAKVLNDRGLLAKRTDAKRLAVRYVPKIGHVQVYALSRAHFGRSTNAAGEAPFTVYDGGRP